MIKFQLYTELTELSLAAISAAESAFYLSNENSEPPMDQHFWMNVKKMPTAQKTSSCQTLVAGDVYLFFIVHSVLKDL